MAYKNSSSSSQHVSIVRPRRSMAATFKSLLRNAKESISGAASDKTPLDEIFPKVDPEVDGEDCLHDCDSCEVKWPRGFKIDEDDELYGYVKGWSTHVLVATGKSDWVRDVADEKGSVMEAIEKKANVKPSNGVCTELVQCIQLLTVNSRGSCFLLQIYQHLPTPQVITNPPLSSFCLPSL